MGRIEAVGILINIFCLLGDGSYRALSWPLSTLTASKPQGPTLCWCQHGTGCRMDTTELGYALYSPG